MKQAKLKSIFIISLVFVALAFYVLANTITLNYPSNEWDTSSDNSLDFNFTASTISGTIPYCALYVNNSGGFLLKANYTDVVNDTPHVFGISINDSAGANGWGWNVTCYNGSSEFYATVAGFGVDGNTPSVTLDSPAAGVYLQNINDTGNFKYTPTDTSNPSICWFYHNVSGIFKINQTNSSYVSGNQILVNLTDRVGTVTNANYPDGVYTWDAVCNDSAGNRAWSSGTLKSISNRTFIVDTVLPIQPGIVLPLNNTFSTDSTPYVAWNQTTELNFDKYEVLLSTNLSFSNVIQTVETSSITRNFTNLSNIENNGTYYIQVRAYELSGLYTNSTIFVYYHLDTDTPEATLNAPLNNSFLNDNTPDFNVTLIDGEPDSCDLLLSKNISSLVLNGTVFMSNNVEQNITLGSFPLNDGEYYYNIECNDSVNNRVNASSTNLKLTILTATPPSPNITSSFHQTNNTDRSPVLRWLEVVMGNFSRYHARAIYVSNNSIAFETNITTRSTTFASMDDLAADDNYIFNVTVYDNAGNTNSMANSSIDMLYYIDPVCGMLQPGWNICGAVWESAKTLSLIGAETGATFLSVFNSSHQFATCNYNVSPTGQHCNVEVNISSVFSSNATGGAYDPSINHAVFIYVEEETNWQNRTWVANRFSANITVTNASGIRWNLEAGYVRNGRTFAHIKDRVKTNISLMSLPYNNGTSVPYVNQGLFRSINNITNVDYGRALWMFYNASFATGTLANTTFDVGGW